MSESIKTANPNLLTYGCSANNLNLVEQAVSPFTSSCRPYRLASLMATIKIGHRFTTYSINWYATSIRNYRYKLTTGLETRYQATLETESILHKQMDSISDSINQLNIQGIPTDQWDLLLVFMFVQKLDPTTCPENIFLIKILHSQSIFLIVVALQLLYTKIQSARCFALHYILTSIGILLR